jgi:hypothetical protein
MPEHYSAHIETAVTMFVLIVLVPAVVEATEELVIQLLRSSNHEFT